MKKIQEVQTSWDTTMLLSLFNGKQEEEEGCTQQEIKEYLS